MAPAEDRLSNLPKNVIETILMRLPIKDIVRTCILSHRWRYLCRTLPRLVFNKETMPFQSDGIELMPDEKCAGIIDHVLLLHHGPIQRFELSCNMERCCDIDRWINFISRNGIKEIFLMKWKGQPYKVPSSLYLCEEMTCLWLGGCTMFLPASFQGFSCLRGLYLERVDFSDNGLQRLISSSPLLERLALVRVSGCGGLKFCAMKLFILILVDVNLQDFCFESTPLLTTLLIYMGAIRKKIVSDNMLCKLSHVFSSLSRVAVLVLKAKTLKILSQGYVPPNFSTATNLYSLFITLNFEDKQQILATLSIFRSSPILTMLSIQASFFADSTDISVGDFWEVHDDFNCFFDRLKIVKFTNFMGSKYELKFVEFVLSKAPVLEMAQIKCSEKVEDELNISREMNRFRRASSKAEIVLLQHQKASILILSTLVIFDSQTAVRP